ncbi:carbohydrate sulfotransferase 9 [Xenopus laevis]|uniref:Carbohydrate sulfotransferase n=2 Tax=Xenopus laevis TaxID=8355 RepID=A0A974C2P7_XENLA|nr:carbohydrate sulfotransferase 9 [Xenopus laevis]OCT64815.1 hypothetical protein XELAEV_18041054mg [Xenopus laevis]
MHKLKPKIFILLVLVCGISGFLFHLKVFEQTVMTQNQRRDDVRVTCRQNNLTVYSHRIKPSIAKQLYVVHSHKFIYCEVPKVGCSNWKRIILLLNSSLKLTADELAPRVVHTSPYLKKLSSYRPAEQVELLNNYTTVMFTRHPLERLVSAYRDKFLHDDTTFYSRSFSNLIKKVVRRNVNSPGRISFEEFVRFIVSENPNYRDSHWKPMLELCDPCNIHYDIVGKFETIKEDAAYVLRSIRAPKDLVYPDIKHYSNETRTNDLITMQYFRSLPRTLYEKLIHIYRFDFSMFEYSPLLKL